MFYRKYIVCIQNHKVKNPNLTVCMQIKKACQHIEKNKTVKICPCPN